LWRFFDVTNLDGLQITTPVRSLIDASLALSVDELGKAIDALRRDNLLDLNALADRVASIKSGRGRGLNRLGLALELRDPNVPAGDSPLETQLNEILSKAGLGGFVTQYEIRTSSGRYRADLAYVEERIVVEADGWSVHGNRTAFDADRERQNAIANAGYLVLRFTSRSSPDRIVSAVRQALLLRRSEVA
jgi:very-short-patch-repair endonuclease